MAAMTRKRANSSVEYRNLHMFSSVVLLLLQQEYIFHPDFVKLSHDSLQKFRQLPLEENRKKIYMKIVYFVVIFT